jgi:peptidoglycan/LPS O-acetylase OafA/YrhL
VFKEKMVWHTGVLSRNTTDMTSSSHPGRFDELDGLRGLASFTVFFSHVYLMQKLDAVPVGISHSFLRTFWDGAAAVFLFFILSGFVLALPYLTPGRRPIELIPYLIRRAFRIYPAYVFALLLSLALLQFVFVQGGLDGLSDWIRSFWTESVAGKEFVRHLTMIGPDTKKIDPPVWTLRLELIISSVFPLIIYVLQGKNSKIVSGAIIAGFAVFFITRPSAVFYFGLFIAGAVLAKFHQELIQIVRRLGSAPGALLLATAFWFYSSRFTIQALATYEVLGQVFASIGAALFILLAISYRPFTVMLRTAPIQFLGHISYAFYLLHFPILQTVGSVVFPRTGSLFLCAAISLAVSVILSHLVAKFVEVPFQRIGRKVSKLPVVESAQETFGARVLPHSAP